jgi:DNA mismatch repair protein MutS
VVFLRRLEEGGASRSYGIQVARLAGLPEAVTNRARAILANLEGDELDASGRPRLAAGAADATMMEPTSSQLGLFGERPRDPREAEVLDALRDLPIDDTTPRAALDVLARWQARLRGEGTS